MFETMASERLKHSGASPPLVERLHFQLLRFLLRDH